MKIHKFASPVIRIILAAVFIFSGLVKLMDPVGTQIKLDEYFSEEVLNLPALIPWSLPFGIMLIVLELSLGVALLIAYRPKITYRITFVLLLFFLFLTGYSYFTGTVTDCGCFGDAVKLTPGETFFKNFVLLGLLLLIWTKPGENARYSRAKDVMMFVTVLAASLFAVWTVHHLPVIDFRPYAVGKNIRKGMEIPPGAKPFIFEDIWYYKVDGKVKAFKTADKPWGIPGAEFVRRETRVVQKGYEPPIHDFDIENDRANITDSILEAPDIYLVLIPFPERLHPSDSTLLTRALQHFTAKNKNFAIITADTLTWLNRWAQAHRRELYFADPTTLKTMIRAPLGLMRLQKAVVREKYSLGDFLEKD